LRIWFKHRWHMCFQYGKVSKIIGYNFVTNTTVCFLSNTPLDVSKRLTSSTLSIHHSLFLIEFLVPEVGVNGNGIVFTKSYTELM